MKKIDVIYEISINGVIIDEGRHEPGEKCDETKLGNALINNKIENEIALWHKRNEEF